MIFCPLRSTAEKEVECSKNCAWYYKSQDSEYTCEINYLTEQLTSTKNQLEEIATNTSYR